MRSFALKTALVFVLIFATTLSQIAPSLAGADENKWRVAFVGVKFENLPPDIQELLIWRITGILEKHASFVLTKPDELQIAYGRKNSADLLDKQDPASFGALAKALQFDYVFSGILANQSTDKNQILLVGQLNRYDFKTGKINTFKISHDHEQFGNALIAFKEQYLDTLPAAKDSGSSIWSRVIVGGIILAGVVAVSFLIRTVRGGGESENRDPQPGDQ